MKKTEQSLKNEARIRKVEIDILRQNSLPDIDFQKLHEIAHAKQINSNSKDDEILKAAKINGEKRKREEEEFENTVNNRTSKTK